MVQEDGGNGARRGVSAAGWEEGDEALERAAAALLAAVAAPDWRATQGEQQPGIEAAMAALHALATARPGDARRLEQLATLRHNLGQLNATSALYAEVNRLDPPHEPDDRQRHAIELLVPLVLTTAAECFALRDCAAIHHPSEPVVAYHFFWEDDWDYPDDDEPSDHEIAWVRYRPKDGVPVETTTYFHGRLLTSGTLAFGMRPVVRVQWGKHGTLPAGWEEIDGVEAVLRRDFEASLRGGRVPDHPRKRRWPPRFPGTWPEYVRFDRPVDPAPLLHANRWVIRGRWANAILYHYCVPYNFHAKREWPGDGLVNL